MAPKEKKVANPAAEGQAAENAPKVKTEVAAQHIAQAKLAREELGKQYGADADRVINHLKQKGPAPPLKRDAANGLLAKIHDGAATEQIAAARRQGEWRKATARELSAQSAIKAERAGDPHSLANFRRAISACSRISRGQSAASSRRISKRKQVFRQARTCRMTAAAAEKRAAAGKKTAKKLENGERGKMQICRAGKSRFDTQANRVSPQNGRVYVKGGAQQKDLGAAATLAARWSSGAQE